MSREDVILQLRIKEKLSSSIMDGVDNNAKTNRFMIYAAMMASFTMILDALQANNISITDYLEMCFDE